MTLVCLVQVTVCLLSKLATETIANDEIQCNTEIQSRHMSESALDLGKQKSNDSDMQSGPMKQLV